MSDKEKKPQEEQVQDAEIIDAEVIAKDETPSQDEAAADATKAQPEPAAKQPATWPGKLALALSVAALGASGYLYWLSLQQGMANQQLASSITSRVEGAISDARGSIDSSLAGMNQKLGQLEAGAQADRSNVDQLQRRVTLAVQQVSAKQQNTRKDWLMAEVEYLLRLANQRVLMEQTPEGALALLKSADKILKETDDVTIYEVRKALAADIVALEAVPQLDVEGVFLQLGAMSTQIDQLRLIPLTEQRELPELLQELTPEVVEASWGAGLSASWNKAMDKFNQLIVIKHRDEPVEPLLSPEQTYYLQQNLHLMLEQAQLALLQRKQGSYDSSLKKAEQWIGTYFEAKDATTQALLRGVRELQGVQVAPELPNISGSLGKHKDYLRQMTKLKEEGAA